MDISPVGIADVGVLDMHQAVALRAHDRSRPPAVVGGVGADEAEDVVGREYLVRDLLRMPALVAFLTELLVRVEVSLHELRREDFRAGRAERLLDPLRHAASRPDAPVGGAVSEELGDHVPGRLHPWLPTDLLDHAAGYQAAHRVGDQVYLFRSCPPADVLYQGVQALPGLHDVEAVGGDLV